MASISETGSNYPIYPSHPIKSTPPSPPSTANMAGYLNVLQQVVTQYQGTSSDAYKTALNAIGAILSAVYDKTPAEIQQFISTQSARINTSESLTDLFSNALDTFCNVSSPADIPVNRPGYPVVDLIKVMMIEGSNNDPVSAEGALLAAECLVNYPSTPTDPVLPQLRALLDISSNTFPVIRNYGSASTLCWLISNVASSPNVMNSPILVGIMQKAAPHGFAALDTDSLEDLLDFVENINVQLPANIQINSTFYNLFPPGITPSDLTNPAVMNAVNTLLNIWIQSGVNNPTSQTMSLFTTLTTGVSITQISPEVLSNMTMIMQLFSRIHTDKNKVALFLHLVGTYNIVNIPQRVINQIQAQFSRNT